MSTEPASPKSYLVGRIREALAHDPRVNDLNLTVTVTGEKVFLSGTVASDERREAVSLIMAESFPELECFNETKVGHYSETQEVEKLT